MAELREPSLLDYARFHGVAVNHLAISPFDHVTTPHESVYDTLSDPPEEPSLDTSHFHLTLEQELLREKLDIQRDGALFLSSVIKEASAKAINVDWGAYLPDIHRIRNMKYELPLLKTDHDLDMASIGKERIALDPATLTLPPEKVEDEHDEGLAFPHHYWELSDEIWGEVKAEKLDCTREALVFIQEARQFENLYTDDMKEELYERELGSVKRKDEQRISPPLLPRDTPFTPYIPSSPTAKLPLLSSPESRIIPEIAAVEQTLLEEGGTSVSAFSNEKRVAETMLRDVTDEESGAAAFGQLFARDSVERTNPSWTEFKIEGPITPPVSSRKRREDDEPKTDSSILRESGLNSTHGETNGDDPNTAGEMLDDHIQEVTYATVRQTDTASKEHLRFVDDDIKANVLRLSPTFIVPPWYMCDSGATADTDVPAADLSTQHIVRLKSCYLADLGTFDVSKMERKMAWQPYQPAAAVIPTEDVIPDDGSVEQMMDLSLEDGVNWGDLLNKTTKSSQLPEYLKYTDDFISGASSLYPNPTVSHSSDTQSTATTRYIGNGITQRAKETKTKTTKQVTKTNTAKYTETIKKEELSFDAGKTEQNVFSSPSAFSTLDSLSSFMETRGKAVKRRKLEHSPFVSSDILHSNTTMASIPPQIHNDACVSQEIQDEREILSANIAPFTLHTLPQITHALTLILSTGLLKTHRHIVERLEDLTPSPTLIFRDYEMPQSHRPLQGPQAFSSMQCPQQLDRAPEADIIISQTTAILLTTLQATTHLHLPGHRPCNKMDGFPSFDSPLRERIGRLSLRYGRIYVLISHSSPEKGPGPQSTTPTTDSRALSSIRSLTAFCASLSTHSTITPLLVTSASQNILEWIITLANKHAYTFPQLEKKNSFTPVNIPKSLPSIAFLQDETPWELFLRQAGLNPFAAQAVLAFIKAQEQEQEQEQEQGQDHGSWNVPHAPDVAGHSNGLIGSGDRWNTQARGLSRFIEMDPKLRRDLFEGTVGTNALKRVESVIEREWQLEEWRLGFPSGL